MIIPIKPMGKPRMTSRDRWLIKADIKYVKDKYLPQKRRLDRYLEYSNGLQTFAIVNHLKLGEVLENITFVLPMGKSWSKKKRARLDGQPHQQKPDLGNLVKAFEDILLAEDKIIHTYNNIRKTWGEKGAIIINE